VAVGDAAAPRQVRRRELVEQRVVEQEAGLLDRRRVVDQGDLAEAGGALVDRELGADDIRPAAGANLVDPPAGEAQLEVLFEEVCALGQRISDLIHERARRPHADGAVHASVSVYAFELGDER
jgi:hypothetical protein